MVAGHLHLAPVAALGRGPASAPCFTTPVMSAGCLMERSDASGGAVRKSECAMARSITPTVQTCESCRTTCGTLSKSGQNAYARPTYGKQAAPYGGGLKREAIRGTC